MNETALIVVGAAVAFGVLSAMIAKARGLRPGPQFLWGLFTGPLGLLSAAFTRVPTVAQPETSERPIDPVGELERLAALKAKGAISEAEFAKAKGRLLG